MRQHEDNYEHYANDFLLNPSSKELKSIDLNNVSKSEDIPRKDKPHSASVLMKLDVRALNCDGTYEPYSMGYNELRQYGLSDSATWKITGDNEADCIKRLKKIMESINEFIG